MPKHDDVWVNLRRLDVVVECFRRCRRREARKRTYITKLHAQIANYIDPLLQYGLPKNFPQNLDAFIGPVFYLLIMKWDFVWKAWVEQISFVRNRSNPCKLKMFRGSSMAHCWYVFEFLFWFMMSSKPLSTILYTTMLNTFLTSRAINKLRSSSDVFFSLIDSRFFYFHRVPRYMKVYTPRCLDQPFSPKWYFLFLVRDFHCPFSARGQLQIW